MLKDSLNEFQNTHGQLISSINNFDDVINKNYDVKINKEINNLGNNYQNYFNTGHVGVGLQETLNGLLNCNMNNNLINNNLNMNNPLNNMMNLNNPLITNILQGMQAFAPINHMNQMNPMNNNVLQMFNLIMQPHMLNYVQNMNNKVEGDLSHIINNNEQDNMDVEMGKIII